MSPWLGIIDLVGGRRDERLIGFGLRESRGLSWRAARLLAVTPEVYFEQQLALHDVAVAGLAHRILEPPRLLRGALFLVRQRERAAPREVIRALRG